MTLVLADRDVLDRVTAAIALAALALSGWTAWRGAVRAREQVTLRVGGAAEPPERESDELDSNVRIEVYNPTTHPVTVNETVKSQLVV